MDSDIQEEFKCKECEKSFDTSVGLSSHMMSHVNEDLVCKVCGRHFRNNRALGCHMAASHKKKRESECPVCGRCFKTLRAERTHEIEAHEEHEDAICEICGKKFSKKRSLNVHMKNLHDIEFNKELRRRIKEIANNDEIKAKRIASYKKTVSTPEWKAKHSNRFFIKKRNAISKRRNAISKCMKHYWAAMSDEEKAKRLRLSTGIKCEYEKKNGDILPCDSTYEQRFCGMLEKDSDVKDFERSTIFIKPEGREHSYNPDFFVVRKDGTKQIVEIKSSWTIKAERVKPNAKAAIAWCKERGFDYLILTEDQLNAYEKTGHYESVNLSRFLSIR